MRARVKIALGLLALLAAVRLLDHLRSAPGAEAVAPAPKPLAPSAGPPVPCPASSLPDQGVCVPVSAVPGVP